jgi:integrase/recombinase XerC
VDFKAVPSATTKRCKTALTSTQTLSGTFQAAPIDAEVVEPAGALATTAAGDALLERFRAAAEQANPLEGILGPRVSRSTATTYRRDWRAFATWLLELAGMQAPLEDDDAVLASLMRWLALGGPQARRLVERWRDEMAAAGKSKAYINRQLQALKYLGRSAEQRGLVENLRLDLVDSVRRGEAIRDMAGPQELPVLRSLVSTAAAVGFTPAGAARNTAVAMLLLQNGLRRGEIARLNLADWSPERPLELRIRGKGRSNRETITISKAAAGAIELWLGLRAEIVDPDGTALPTEPEAPLFCGTDRAVLGRIRSRLATELAAAHAEAADIVPGSAPWVELISEAYRCCRLDGSAIYRLVSRMGQATPEISKTLSPHRLRHSAVTALVNNGVDLAGAQAFARHASPSTTAKYFDNKAERQAASTELLAQLTAEVS